MTRATAENSRRSIAVADLNSSIDGEPRMMDLTLAEALGFARPSNIRRIISRHTTSLKRFGEVCSTVERTLKSNDNLGGRPGKAYYLNKKQALYICTKSETENATEVTIQMVEVFDAYTSGKPIHVREHDRRTSTKVDDALRLKNNIDRLESVVTAMQPAAPNFCAMVIDGEPVFVDVNKYDGVGRAVVVGHDGRLKIEYVEPVVEGFRHFGRRSAMGERSIGKGGIVGRSGVVVVGMILEPDVEQHREQRVNEATDKLRRQITTLLDAGPYDDQQIARKLCCNPKLVREVRRIQSRKPTDIPSGRVIEHEERAPYRERVVALIRQGYGNAEIARMVGCSDETVRRHRNRSL